MKRQTTWEYPKGARVVGFELFGVHAIGASGRPEEKAFNPKARRWSARTHQEAQRQARPALAFPSVESARDANHEERGEGAVSCETRDGRAVT
jgi:hypothetical protein